MGYKILTKKNVFKKTYDYWFKKNRYYHDLMAQLYRFIIPEGSRVLQVGCKTGHLLGAVNSSFGVGVDTKEERIQAAREAYPSCIFFTGTLSSVHLDDARPFDYVVLSSTIMEVDDIQDLFEDLHRFCDSQTRIIIDSYSYIWEPTLWLLQKLGLRRPTNLKNWISFYDIKNFLHLADFDVVKTERHILVPAYIPFISWFINNIVALIPLIDRLCLSQWIIARPKRRKLAYTTRPSVSVIIPCRNEKGNLEPAVNRVPDMGSWTEIIFVEGHSKDGTVDEIKRIIAKYPDKRISWHMQLGKGKGDAVRLGFKKAKGDILMIQDADLTAPPEDLPKFYDALVRGKGEFINGSRLVYGMESKAMRFLNLIANHSFALGFSWLLGQRVKDTLCGTKVLYKKDYETIAKNRSFFGDFDPFGDFDLLFGAAKQSMKIVDIPVQYKARQYGSTQIRRFYHGLILLYMSWYAFIKFKMRV